MEFIHLTPTSDCGCFSLKMISQTLTALIMALKRKMITLIIAEKTLTMPPSGGMPNIHSLVRNPCEKFGTTNLG